GRAPDGLQRRAPQGQRQGHRPRGSDGEVILVAGLRARDFIVCRVVRRLRLHQRLSRREVLSRCQDRDHLRGYVEYAAADYSEGGPQIKRTATEDYRLGALGGAAGGCGLKL